MRAWQNSKTSLGRPSIASPLFVGLKPIARAAERCGVAVVSAGPKVPTLGNVYALGVSGHAAVGVETRSLIAIPATADRKIQSMQSGNRLSSGASTLSPLRIAGMGQGVSRWTPPLRISRSSAKRQVPARKAQSTSGRLIASTTIGTTNPATFGGPHGWNK